MLILETIYLILSSLLFYPVGRVFFRNLDFVVQFFFGLLIASILLSFTARFSPSFSREILAFTSFTFTAVLFKNYKHDIAFLISDFINFLSDNLKKILKFFAIFLIFTFLLREFSPLFYLFESHDVHIFGPTIEVFNADYLGNIRNPITFPLELSAYHILPGIFLGVANFLNPSIDLVTLINAKFILISFFFSYGFFKVLDYFNFSFFSIAAGLILLFFFKETIGYNLSISSYLYQLVLMFVAIIFFELDATPNNQTLQEAFIALLMMMLCIKIPIFYVIIPSLLYLFFQNPKLFFKPRLFSIAALCFLSLLTIVLIPQSPQIAEITKYSIMNILDYDSARSLAGLWFVENRFLGLFNFLNIYFLEIQIFHQSLASYLNLAIKVSYILIFYFGLSFFALKFFKPSVSKQALKIYIISAIFGWFFIRNNGNLDQQNHLFFNISILSLMLFFRVIPSIQNFLNFNAINVLVVIIFTFALTDVNNFVDPRLSGDSTSYRKINSITFKNFKNLSPQIDGDRLIIDPDIPFWKHALISQMHGKRIYHDDLVINNINFNGYHLSQYTLEEDPY
jgi:hypothetical protein